MPGGGDAPIELGALQYPAELGELLQTGAQLNPSASMQFDELGWRPHPKICRHQGIGIGHYPHLLPLLAANHSDFLLDLVCSRCRTGLIAQG